MAINTLTGPVVYPLATDGGASLNQILGASTTEAGAALTGIQLTPVVAPTYKKALTFYDNVTQSLAYYNDVTNNTVHVGQEVQTQVYNNTGSAIPMGTPVYLTTTSVGGDPNVAPAFNTTTLGANCIGIANTTIPAASVGYVVILGQSPNLDTSAFSVGAALYVGATPGTFTTTQPLSPAYAVRVGYVLISDALVGRVLITKANVYVNGSSIISPVSLTAASNFTNAVTIYGYSTGQAVDIFNVTGYATGPSVLKVTGGASTNGLQVGIGMGFGTPAVGTVLDVQSTTGGVRFPNMTTTIKSGITPAAGTVVFDTTLAKLCVYSGAAWQTITSV